MKKFFLFTLFLFALGYQGAAQATDTTIYLMVDQKPRFPGCERLDTTLVVKEKCAESSLLTFLYSNIRYPVQARVDDIQGTVVVSFVVEPDSLVSNIEIVKDIGGGCAAEAVRVIDAMNEIGVRWVPGIKDGEAKRVRYTLPVRFKLEDPPPFVIVGRDSIYVELENPLQFKGGDEALVEYLNKNLKYPSEFQDSCFVGDLGVNIWVDRDGIVKVLEVSDYNNLGEEFQFSAVETATSTFGEWIPATYAGRNVPTTLEVSMAFRPSNPTCASEITRYEQSIIVAEEGVTLFNEGDKEGGLAKLTEAVEAFPMNANYRYMRGQIYLNEKQYEQACEDLTVVKQVLATKIVDNVLPIICNQTNQ